jgi:hypothetical protein
MPATKWTARQARYNGHAMVCDVSEGGALPVQYAPTRHGIVARCWLGPDYIQVALLRRGNTASTFQGTVELAHGGWKVTDARGNSLGAFTGDYLDAEAPLLRLRTGVRSATHYRWPRHLLAELRPPKATCPTCGNDLTPQGACNRPDVHW